MPTPAIAMTTGPSPGFLNHSVAEKYISTAAANRNTTPPMSSLRFISPPTVTAASTPKTAPMARAAGMGISGFLRKLLNPMAPNSFRRTATQKIGREKNRKAMKVTP